MAAERGVALELTGPGSVRAGVETPVVERILQPIVENACRFARARVVVAVGVAGREVRIEVADDGPGVAAEDLEATSSLGSAGRPRAPPAGAPAWGSRCRGGWPARRAGTWRRATPATGGVSA